jgi:CelD/BcsL family acetyltransferase involved in cellulose biosynthesis
MGVSWAGYWSELSSHITENLKRLRRKAERQHGAMSVHTAEPRPEEVDQALETVVSIEGSGWKGRNGSSLARRGDLREFFRRYCRRAAEKGRLRVTTISFGSHIAAVELAIEAYRRLWQLKIGYSEALRSFYPGLHLTEASIRSAYERRLESFEFLGSAADWERRWNPEERRYQVVALYPLSVAGILTGCRDVAGRVWRRASSHVAAISH